MTDQLTPDQTVRLLCAKVGELETQVLNGELSPVNHLAADIALVAELLAQHIRTQNALMAEATALITRLSQRVRQLEDSSGRMEFE